MEKIITGTHKAQMDGYPSYRQRLAALSERMGHPWNGTRCAGPGVSARVDFGRWIAVCECGGAEYVTPDDPIFYCCSCGNASTGGAARPVCFPADMAVIEEILLARPMEHMGGRDEAEQAMRAKATVPGLVRNWTPGESIQDLRMQNRTAKILAEVKHGV